MMYGIYYTTQMERVSKPKMVCAEQVRLPFIVVLCYNSFCIRTGIYTGFERRKIK